MPLPPLRQEEGLPIAVATVTMLAARPAALPKIPLN